MVSRSQTFLYEANTRGLDGAFDRAARQMGQLERETRKWKREVEKLNKELDGLDEASDEARDLRREIERLETATSDANKEFNRLNRQSQRMGRMRSALRGIGVALGAVTAGFAAVGAIMSKTISRYQELSKEANEYGLTAGQAATAQIAGLNAGLPEDVGLDIFGDINKELPLRIQEAINAGVSGGRHAITDLSQQIGVDLIGAFAGIEDPVEKFRRAYSLVQQEIERSGEGAGRVLADTLVGETAGERLIGLAGNPAQGDAFLSTITDSGLTETLDQQLVGVEKMTMAWGELKGQLVQVGFAITSTLGPVLIPLVEKIGNVAGRVVEWLQANPRLARTLFVLAAVVGGILTAAILGLSIAFGAMAVAGAIATLGLAPFLIIILAVIAAVALLAVGIYTVLKLFGKAPSGFRDFGNEAKKLTSSLGGLASGDVPGTAGGTTSGTRFDAPAYRPAGNIHNGDVINAGRYTDRVSGGVVNLGDHIGTLQDNASVGVEDVAALETAPTFEHRAVPTARPIPLYGPPPEPITTAPAARPYTLTERPLSVEQPLTAAPVALPRPVTGGAPAVGVPERLQSVTNYNDITINTTASSEETINDVDRFLRQEIEAGELNE